jgi:hypothetical protein
LAVDLLEINDDLIEKMGIHQSVVSSMKSLHEFVEREGVPCAKGEFPQNDIVPGHLVAVDGDLSDNIAGPHGGILFGIRPGRRFGMILGKCGAENEKIIEEEGVCRPMHQMFR